MFLRCFYAAGGDLAVAPLFLPVGCECVTTGLAASPLPPPPRLPPPPMEFGAVATAARHLPAAGWAAGWAGLAAGWADLGACYTQSKRWQWGAVDLGFIIVQNWVVGGGGGGSGNPAVRGGGWRRGGAGGWAFALGKCSVLAAAYEHHLVLAVMW